MVFEHECDIVHFGEREMVGDMVNLLGSSSSYQTHRQKAKIALTFAEDAVIEDTTKLREFGLQQDEIIFLR